MQEQPPAATPYVFISYASVDRERALALADGLEAAGVRVWLDRRSLVGGASWDASIVEAIKRCTVFLLLASSRSVTSPNVTQELRLSWEEQRPALPLLLHAVTFPAEMRYILAGRQWLELLGRPEADWLPDLLRALAGFGLTPRGALDPNNGELAKGQPATAENGAQSSTPVRNDDKSLQATAAPSPTHTAGSGALRPFLTHGQGAESPAEHAAPISSASSMPPLSGERGLGSAASSSPTNLPAALTSFIGREREVAALAQALHEARVVTLTGVGGIGKTRLALHAAAGALADFQSGIWLCELAPIRDPAAVAETAAAVFGLAARPGETPAETLAAYLRDKQILLLLDNCEQVLDAAAALVNQIARGCPHVTILATSREALGIVGERVIAVPPLAAPRPEAELSSAAETAAVRLFVERAGAVRAGFVLTAANAGDVGEVCRRLDGIPLAIELAAARIAVLSPRELARRLDQRFRLLAGGRRGVERHETLRAAIDWSYALLSEPEQRLLIRLSVFVGGWTLESVETVATGDGIEPDQVFELLAGLVTKSLVVVDGEDAEETRYRLLETISEYAAERLAEHSETNELRAHHAGYFVGWTESASQALRGPDEAAWTRRVNREQENIRAAMLWAIEADNADIALRLLVVAGLMPMIFLPVAGVLSALALPALAITGAGEHPQRVAGLVRAGMHAVSRGEAELANRLCDEALQAEAMLGAPPDAYLRAFKALAAIGLGQIDEGIDGWSQGTAIDRAKGDMIELAMSLGMDAYFRVLHDKGDGYDLAVADATEGMSLARQTGSPTSITFCLGTLGFVIANTEPQRGRGLLRESIDRSMSLGRPDGQMHGLLALLAAQSGDCHEALAQAEQAIEFRFWYAERMNMGVILNVVARALADTAPEAAAVIEGAAELLDAGYGGFRQIARLRDDTQRTLAERLDEGRLSALLAEGRAMSEDQAATYARARIHDALANL